MASTLYLSPLTFIVQYFTNVGVIAAGATIQTNLAGSVSTPQITYTDSTGLVPNSNPITLNSAGRAAAASGALTAFWQPAGVSIDAIFTDTLGETWAIRNIPGINDPSGTSSLQTLLATATSSNSSGSGPVAGADLVANSVKSYDIFADVRAANVPAMAANQTLIVIAQGAATVGDGLGGAFYWNPTSGATDDNSTVLNPSGTSGNGRYLRLVSPQTALQTVSGSFTASTADVTGGTNTGTIYYTRVGQMVTLSSNNNFSGTSASISMSLTGMPAAILPTRVQQGDGIIPACADNSVGCGAALIVTAGGSIVASKVTPATFATSNWTNSGTKTLGPFNMTYALN